MSEKYNLLVLLGPTASGKTALGVKLAAALGGEIVSADSRQVYRELDLGAGKDRESYRLGPLVVPVHLIDVVDLGRQYSVFDYQRDAYRVLGELLARGVLPVMVGGSGMYLEAVLLDYHLPEVNPDPALRKELESLDDRQLMERLLRVKPRLHATTDTSSRQNMIRAIEIAELSPLGRRPSRPPLAPLVLGVEISGPELGQRIRQRLRRRLEAGLIEEVEKILAGGTPPERLEALGLEYRFVTRYLRGDIADREQLFAELSRAIVAFARRQRTWFRRMQRRGVTIIWLRGDVERQALELVREKLPERWRPQYEALIQPPPISSSPR